MFNSIARTITPKVIQNLHINVPLAKAIKKGGQEITNGTIRLGDYFAKDFAENAVTVSLKKGKGKKLIQKTAKAGKHFAPTFGTTLKAYGYAAYKTIARLVKAPFKAIANFFTKTNPEKLGQTLEKMVEKGDITAQLKKSALKSSKYKKLAAQETIPGNAAKAFTNSLKSLNDAGAKTVNKAGYKAVVKANATATKEAAKEVAQETTETVAKRTTKKAVKKRAPRKTAQTKAPTATSRNMTRAEINFHNTSGG